MGSGNSFEERYDSIIHEIEKRRRGWTLTSVSFDDVRQEILIHVNKKLYQFDENKMVKGKKVEFTHWLNALISSRIKNILRDNYVKWSRPCIQGCPFNMGDHNCRQTASGKQCAECPIFASWEKRKLSHHNVKQTLPLENHVQEVESVQSDFIDIEGKKKIIDEKVMEKLNKHDRKMYKMLFIQGKSEAEVGKIMGYKQTGRMHAGYLTILKLKHKVVALARTVIDEEDLA